MEDFLPPGERLTGDSDKDFRLILQMMGRDVVDELLTGLVTEEKYDDARAAIAQLRTMELLDLDKAVLLLAEGQIAIAEEDFLSAGKHLDESERLSASHGSWSRAITCNLYQAIVCHRTGDLRGAVEVQGRFEHYREQNLHNLNGTSDDIVAQYAVVINGVVGELS